MSPKSCEGGPQFYAIVLQNAPLPMRGLRAPCKVGWRREELRQEHTRAVSGVPQGILARLTFCSFLARSGHRRSRQRTLPLPL